jgi:hypothetical protein
MDECIHGMNPDWCANCKKLMTPEEEAEFLERQANLNFDKMLKRWENSD